MIRLRDDLQPLYRTMLLLGAVALAIFAVGFVLFLRLAPPGQPSGLRARIVGVFAYDANSHRLSGHPSTEFPRDQDFAARIDWAALPPQLVVGARWYDALQEPVGGVGPEPAGRLAATDPPVVERIPPGFGINLPGTYTLLVMRYADGQPVEVLARASVVVERS